MEPDVVRNNQIEIEWKVQQEKVQEHLNKLEKELGDSNKLISLKTINDSHVIFETVGEKLGLEGYQLLVLDTILEYYPEATIMYRSVD